MNCSIHSDALCTSCCCGCGKLLCDRCDVLYLDRHCCRDCAKHATLLHARMGSSPRSWISRLTDRLFSHWIGFPLLALGILVTGLGLACVETLAHGEGSTFIIGLTPSGTLAQLHMSSGPDISRALLCIIMQVGAIGLLAGVYMIANRFSLRGLLAGVLGAALLSAYPLLRLSPSINRVHTVEVTAPANISASQRERIAALLAPVTVMSTLPTALLDELALKPGEGVERATVLPGSGRDIHCELEFSENISTPARAMLEEMYNHYIVLLTCRRQLGSYFPASFSASDKYLIPWEVQQLRALPN